MKTRHSVMAGLAAVLLSSSIAMAVAMENGADLVKKRCSMCHDVSRICPGLGKRDMASWQQTVQNMMGNGASLAEGEAAKIAAYLTTPQAADGLGCAK